MSANNVIIDMRIYRKVWRNLGQQVSVDLIKETVRVIEASKVYPTPTEYCYDIWQEYLKEVKKEKRKSEKSERD